MPKKAVKTLLHTKRKEQYLNDVGRIVSRILEEALISVFFLSSATGLNKQVSITTPVSYTHLTLPTNREV